MGASDTCALCGPLVTVNLCGYVRAFQNACLHDVVLCLFPCDVVICVIALPCSSLPAAYYHGNVCEDNFFLTEGFIQSV